VSRPGETPGSIFSMLHRAFGDPVMEALFSESATVEAWLRTEAALARAQARVGDLPAERAEAIASACRLENVDLAALWRDMANVGYPILPLVRQVTERLPASEQGSLHYGATTQDIMDTGLALQLAAAIDRLLELTESLGDALAAQAEAHAATVMAGRTHGQQAVPTTFGAKLATYLWQCQRLRSDLHELRGTCCLVSLHGAAGTSAGLGPRADEVRTEMAGLLGLAVPGGPWHVTRDGLAAFGAACSRAAAACARLAREVIDLSRTEIREVSESEGHHRGASSTMPQKANPIDSEAIVGLAISAAAVAGSLYRAMEAGHERSAGEWQVEWHGLPAACSWRSVSCASPLSTRSGWPPTCSWSRAARWPRPTCSSWLPSSAGRAPTTSCTSPPRPRKPEASACARRSARSPRTWRGPRRSTPPTTSASRRRRRAGPSRHGGPRWPGDGPGQSQRGRAVSPSSPRH
jgi:3-carboxy-cis,cis-muconate cycloisomerase